jgi:tetratricopeptide (TPR) repeat protein
LLVVLALNILIGDLAGAAPVVDRVPVTRWPDRVAEDLVRTYRSGKTDEAIAALIQRLTDEQGDNRGDAVERMVLWVRDAGQQTRTRIRSWRGELEALLLLTTDALIETWPERSLFAPEKNNLWRPLETLYDTLKGLDQTSPFLRQWYLIWEAFRQSNILDGWRGWPTYFNDALNAFPRDSQVLLAAGARQELEWWIRTNPRRTLSDIPATRPADLHAALIASRNYLRRSLEANPAESEAALRLTRVLIELDDLDAARQVLAARTWSRGEPAFEYLAHLFEGELAERHGDWSSAIAAYDRAIVLVPTPQSALVGKAHALHAADRRADALQAATQALSGPDQPPDPWWVYSLGQSWRLTPYLRAARAWIAR